MALRFMHLRQSLGRAASAPAAAPLFAPLELVDVRHPSREERAAVEEVRQHPPDLAGIAASALAAAERAAAERAAAERAAAAPPS